MELYLVRHTQVALPAGRCYGRNDVELAASWPADSALLQAKLPDEFDTVYSSPLARCRHFADQISDSVQFDQRLQELDFGAWEGIPWDRIPRRELDDWSADFVNRPVPGGESYGQLVERVSAFLDQRLQQQPADTLIVVTHAGVIRALLARLLELPLMKSVRIGLDYGSVSKATLHGDWTQVDYINR